MPKFKLPMFNSKEPLVSIGLPVYNGERYLKEALDSLLAQTYKNFEIIISDNASSDKTAEICEAYLLKDKRIKYIRQSKNIGQVANFNFVLEKSEGKYFMWAAHDDLWDERFIEKCVLALEGNPEAVMAFSVFERFNNENGVRVRHNPESYLPTEKNLYGRLKKHILLPWSEGKGEPMYGVFVRSKIGEDKFENYLGFDVNFIFRNLARGIFILVDELLFFKRDNRLQAKDSPRGLVQRVFFSFAYRLKRVFTPFFCSEIASIWKLKDLKFAQKIKLTFWVLFFISRLFWRRKM